MFHGVRTISLILLVLAGCESRPSKLDNPATGGAAPGSAAAPATAPNTPDVPPTTAQGGDTGKAAAPDPWLTTPETPKDPLKRPMFWSVAKDGKTTYLLGTMHLGVDAEKRLPDLVWKQLDSAPTLAVEADLNEGSSIDMARKDGSLKQDLGPEYWKKLEAAITPQVAASIDKMKPMVATTFLSMKGLDGTPAMDSILVGRAIRLKKPVVYLEAASKQLAILEKWMNVKALKMMLDHLEETEANTKQLLAAYLEGDEQKLVALGDDDRKTAKESGFTDAELDEQMQELLYARNADWIPKIEELHGKGDAFIAVGAMHLIGKKSVLELLGAKGYKISRITP